MSITTDYQWMLINNLVDEYRLMHRIIIVQ